MKARYYNGHLLYKHVDLKESQELIQKVANTIAEYRNRFDTTILSDITPLDKMTLSIYNVAYSVNSSSPTYVLSKANMNDMADLQAAFYFDIWGPIFKDVEEKLDNAKMYFKCEGLDEARFQHATFASILNLLYQPRSQFELILRYLKWLDDISTLYMHQEARRITRYHTMNNTPEKDKERALYSYNHQYDKAIRDYDKEDYRELPIAKGIYSDLLQEYLVEMVTDAFTNNFPTRYHGMILTHDLMAFYSYYLTRVERLDTEEEFIDFLKLIREESLEEGKTDNVKPLILSQDRDFIRDSIGMLERTADILVHRMRHKLGPKQYDANEIDKLIRAAFSYK